MPEVKDYRLHPLAWQEVEAADDCYLSHSIDASLAFLTDLQVALENVSHAPNRWPKYLYETRRLVMQRFPFSVIYLDDPDSVIIVAVAHSKRRPGYWKDRV